MSEFQLCACGSAPGYPHRKDCPRPLYNPTDAQFEQWEKEWLAKTEQLNMKTQHTPTPWTMIKHGTPKHSPQFGIYAEAEGQPTDLAIVCHTDNAEANAAFIVRACNCHEDLLEACTSMLEWMEFTIPRLNASNTERMNWGGPINKARNAIAKATQE